MNEVTLLNRHRILVGLAAIGRRNIDIARATSMSPSTVCRILKRKPVIEAIEKLQERLFKAVLVAKWKPRPEVISLIENLAEEIECPALNDESRMRALKNFLDLTLGVVD